ncbi:MAG TPA: hypothetical protein VMV88_05965 [Gallionella sp.]|nr:hypothetical protein [Gallionella sp.]
MRFPDLDELIPRLEKLGEPVVRRMQRYAQFEAYETEAVQTWLASLEEERKSLVSRAKVQELHVRQAAADSVQAANKRKDIKLERGCRRLIRDNWPDISNLYSKDADGHQVLVMLNRKMEEGKTRPSLKTVQNCLIELRKENLLN